MEVGSVFCVGTRPPWRQRHRTPFCACSLSRPPSQGTSCKVYDGCPTVSAWHSYGMMEKPLPDSSLSTFVPESYGQSERARPQLCNMTSTSLEECLYTRPENPQI